MTTKQEQVTITLTADEAAAVENVLHVGIRATRAGARHLEGDVQSKWLLRATLAERAGMQILGKLEDAGYYRAPRGSARDWSPDQ